MKRAVANLLLAGIVTVVVLGLAELVLHFSFGEQILPYRLRLHDPNLTGENYLEYGARVPFQLRADYSGSFVNNAPIHTDRHGLRRTGTPVEDHADVLCLGDSFTFGYLLGDTRAFPAALQQILDVERPGLIVANGGYAGGFSFDGAYVRYEQDLQRLAPRLVVVGVYPGNDYQDLASNVWTEVGDDGRPLAIVKARHLIVRRVYQVPVLRESRLFVGLASALLAWRVDDPVRNALDGRVDWDQVDVLVRSFASATRKRDAKLVFVFLREPGRITARFEASHSGRSFAEVVRAIEEQNDRLEAILDRYGVIWFDDRELLASAKATLRRNAAPELRAIFAPHASDMMRARQFTADPDRILAAADSIHYSWLMNVLFAQWLFEKLDARDLLPIPVAAGNAAVR